MNLLLALLGDALLFTVGFLYTRRRAQALHARAAPATADGSAPR